jgi:hypothetical protein
VPISDKAVNFSVKGVTMNLLVNQGIKMEVLGEKIIYFAAIDSPFLSLQICRTSVP